MDTLKIKTLYLEITHACNQNCKHCYLDGGIHQVFEELNTEEIKDILFNFKNQGGNHVIITGGEPTVRKDCFEILDYLESLDIPFTFASNSLIMNDEKLERLSRYRNLNTYFTSLLGSTAEEHEYICNNNSYPRVFKALDYFDARGIKTYVQVTLAHNYIYKMESIANKLSKYQHCTIKFTPIASFGIKSSCSHKESIIVPSKEFGLFNSMIEILKKKHPKKIEDGNIQNYDQILSLIDDYKDDYLYSLKYGFLALRPNGDKSFSCNMGNPYVFGNAKAGVGVIIDDKLIEYISVLREAEQLVLQEAKENIVELDTAIDNSIKLIYKKLYQNKLKE
jgi:MoaA/NifB/PqqE/SkfB family radical SAM enzyme